MFDDKYTKNCENNFCIYTELTVKLYLCQKSNETDMCCTFYFKII